MSCWLHMHAAQDLVNKLQRQADITSFLLPCLVWPSCATCVLQTEKLDIASPQDGKSQLCTAVAWLLQERDYSIGITTVVFHNLTSSSGSMTARSMQLMLTFTQQPEPGRTHLIGPICC